MNAMPHDQEGAEISQEYCPEGSPIGAFRAAVVTEAKTWIGTPFHHAARVKGAGVDCLMLLAEVYERAGVTAGRINPPFYVPDWHLHRDAERYMEGLCATPARWMRRSRAVLRYSGSDGRTRMARSSPNGRG